MLRSTLLVSLARAAQNGVSMFVSVYGAATARERSFSDVLPEIG
jgi:hypothetical protein